jgi:hypothetical protein
MAGKYQLDLPGDQPGRKQLMAWLDCQRWFLRIRQYHSVGYYGLLTIASSVGLMGLSAYIILRQPPTVGAVLRCRSLSALFRHLAAYSVT